MSAPNLRTRLLAAINIHPDTPDGIVIDARIAPIVTEVDNEIRRLRRLARDLYADGDFYGSHEPECDCAHCIACVYMRSRGRRAP